MALTPEQFTEIFERVSIGNSLSSCLRAIPCGFDTFYKGLENDKELSERYARARSHQAESSHSKILEATDRVLSGDLDPNAARVAIDALKWNAARLHPAIYGDKVQLANASGTGPAELKISWDKQ